MKEKTVKALKLDDSLLDMVHGGNGDAMLDMNCILEGGKDAMPDMNSNLASVSSVPSVILLYQTHEGDCFSVLAEKYNTSVAMILSLNHIADPDHVESGRWIRIPCNQK